MHAVLLYYFSLNDVILLAYVITWDIFKHTEITSRHHNADNFETL